MKVKETQNNHVSPRYASTTTLSVSGQLNLTMLRIGVCLIAKVQSQFACNGENWITEGNMSSPSMLGGDMRKFKHIDWWNS